MANGKTRKIRAASKATPNRTRKGFNLDAHKAAIIVGLISLVGVLAASTIGNWDKLRGNQATLDTTADLLAYNEQRRVMVEGAYDQALSHVQEAQKKVTGPEAEVLRSFAVSLREKKAAVQSQYDKVLAAIRDNKPVQAEINKTELNTVILTTQKDHDEFRLTFKPTFKTQPSASEVSNSKTQLDDPEYTVPNDVETSDWRFPGVASSTPAPKSILPSMTFPIGRERNKPSELFTLAQNTRTGNPARPAESLSRSVEGGK